MAHTPRETTSPQTGVLASHQSHSQSNAYAYDCQDPSRGLYHLPTDGHEAFLPALDCSLVYELTVTGTCQCFRTEIGVFRNKCVPDGNADGLYGTDKHGAFTVTKNWLCINGTCLNSLVGEHVLEISEEDREGHRYRLLLGGTGAKLALRIERWWNRTSTTPPYLSVTMHVLPAGTVSPLERWNAQCRDRENERLEQWLMPQIESLRCKVQREPEFLNPESQKQFVERNWLIIINLWADDWTTEYNRVILNTQLKTVAEKHAPEVLQWLQARIEMIRAAQRLDLQRPPREKLPPPPEREITAEETRALKLREAEVQAEDKIALTKQKLAKIAEGHREIDSQNDVDPELRERMKSELTESILEGEDDGNPTTSL